MNLVNNNSSKKKLLLIKVIGGFVALMLPILFILIIVGSIISPILIFFNGNTSEINRNEASFITAILDREEHWQSKGVSINKELLLSILLYNKDYDPEKDYTISATCKTTNVCSEKERENKQLIENATALADGQVKESGSYKCRFIGADNNSWVTCPGDESSCYGQGYCNGSQDQVEVQSTSTASLKTQEEFIEWLKSEDGYNLKEKIGKEDISEATLDSIIEEMVSNYDFAMGAKSNGNNKLDLSQVASLVSLKSGKFNGSFVFFTQYDSQWAGNCVPYSGFPCLTFQHGACAITSAAMIMSSLTQKYILPTEIANKYCDPSICLSVGSNGFSLLEKAIADYSGYNLTFSGPGYGTGGSIGAADMQNIINALETGNSLVMISLKPGSIVNCNHAVVLYDVDSNGNFKMADPGYSANNYSYNNKTFTLREIMLNTEGYGIVSRSNNGGWIEKYDE